MYSTVSPSLIVYGTAVLETGMLPKYAGSHVPEIS